MGEGQTDGGNNNRKYSGDPFLRRVAHLRFRGFPQNVHEHLPENFKYSSIKETLPHYAICLFVSPRLSAVLKTDVHRWYNTRKM